MLVHYHTQNTSNTSDTRNTSKTLKNTCKTLVHYYTQNIQVRQVHVVVDILKQTQHGEQSWLCRCCWPRTCHLRDNCKVFVIFFILILNNNNNNNIVISPLKKGWRSFHQSTKEPSRKICVLTMRSLLDIASEGIVLKILYIYYYFTKKICFLIMFDCWTSGGLGLILKEQHWKSS